MQKLSKRKTYTPKDAPQVPGSVTTYLNKDESLSGADKQKTCSNSSKTFDNNSDVDQRQHTAAQTISGIVYVLGIKGQPLMPTTSPKARKLLHKKLARVVKRKPFTIQLSVPCRNKKQPITLGIDAGSRFIGFSAITKKKELVSGELKQRTDVKDLLKERQMYRNNRRAKLWYRQKRFDNRKREEGWLAPSIQHKLDTHQRLIDKMKMLLPINNVVIEVAKFDTQKLQNADIKGVKYQQGQMSGYNNLRAFIFTRDKYTCQICKEQGGILETHHIIQRKNGGSNRPDNLVTLHLKCHKDFHSGKIKHKFTKPKSFKDTSIMNNVWSRLVTKNKYKHTFGYITKDKRQKLELEKSHVNDAFVIAGGSRQIRNGEPLSYIKKRRNNRCLQLNRKGFTPSIKRQRYKIQPKDLVWINNKVFECSGTHCKGTRILVNKKSLNIKLVQKHYARGGLIC